MKMLVEIDTATQAVVPKVPTVSNEMKAKFIGEFSWSESLESGEDEVIEHTVPWWVCKEIFHRMVQNWIAAAPRQEPVQQQDRLRFKSACEISGDKHPEYVRGYEAAMDAVCMAQPAPTPTGWQPIETAPNDVHVLVHYAKHITDLEPDWQWDSDAHRTFVAMRSGGYWIQNLGIGESLIVEPTHWQPLPPAPGGSDE